nr:MAG TPA: hypothetical protein [Caudoviricetes sp.]
MSFLRSAKLLTLPPNLDYSPLEPDFSVSLQSAWFEFSKVCQASHTST